MTDSLKFNIKFDQDLNVEIQSNSLDDETRKTLEYVVNSRENGTDNPLPEIQHTITSGSFSHEVVFTTNEGKILDIVEDFNKLVNEEFERLDRAELTRIDDIQKQLDKEFEALEKGELKIEDIVKEAEKLDQNSLSL